MPNSQRFHRDLRVIAHLLPGGAFNRRTLPVIRALTRLQARRSPKDVEVAGLPSGISVRLHRPPHPDNAGGALLWIHGGGYVIGSAAQDDRLCRRFADRLGVPVASVDYRLAPKHPYPAALEDCYEALAWLTRLPGIDPTRVAIGGASAGGGLTAALALLARDRGELAPVFQLMVYPMVDDRSCDRPGVRNRRYRMWNPNTNRLGWTAYLNGADPQVAVPSRHDDLSGLPRAWIGVGTLDPLHDENVEYARRLEDAGVACDLDIVTGAFHGFDIVAPAAGVSRTFFDRQCEALRKAFSS
ncbi:alpha/beta hydrolase [Mycobacterium colombiense]|uniref:Alpha/beta hydrolase n=1 Tax=Mycobacterium colombiense TaxID=339268 RepID=A0A853LZ36_9MYCO|nr:alpha/beta hydrolase [Mycobacterium colombiense]OBJ21343.1 alpha/beta hydrolase [Mycobacterium colombiense]OBJ60784.1 alpha/beta hydrolase [Mycobacterium colombiense]